MPYNTLMEIVCFLLNDLDVKCKAQQRPKCDDYYGGEVEYD